MKRAVTSNQNVSRMCLVCGTDNPLGLHGRFLQIEGDEIVGIFMPLQVHQGYPGRLHGGMLTAMLDETIGRAVNITDASAWGVTVELTVRFKRPVPLDEEVRVIARITSDKGRLFEGTGEIRLKDGTLAVEAAGRYLRQPIDRIATGDFEREWFPDTRPAPAEIDV